MNSGCRAGVGPHTRLALANLPKTAATHSTSFATISSQARLYGPFERSHICNARSIVRALCPQMPSPRKVPYSLGQFSSHPVLWPELKVPGQPRPAELLLYV